MEKEDTISVQWAQEDVETSYRLVNNNNAIKLTQSLFMYIYILFIAVLPGPDRASDHNAIIS
jgi:hypothetical protein